MKHNYKTFNDAAEGALKKIIRLSETSLSDKEKFKPIERYLSNWITTLHKGVDDITSDTALAASVLSRAGVEALNWFKDTGTPFDAKEMVTLLCMKQHDYGHNNITNFGIIGVAVRVCDKIARIANLEKVGIAKNESMLDSYLDIIGYSIIAIMLDEDSFKLNLRKNS